MNGAKVMVIALRCCSAAPVSVDVVVCVILGPINWMGIRNEHMYIFMYLCMFDIVCGW